MHKILKKTIKNINIKMHISNLLEVNNKIKFYWSQKVVVNKTVLFHWFIVLNMF